MGKNAYRRSEEKTNMFDSASVDPVQEVLLLSFMTTEAVIRGARKCSAIPDTQA